MSAPNAGRQSPEPETQSGAQTGAPASNIHHSDGKQTGNDKPNDLENLASNPGAGAMDKIADDSTRKTDPATENAAGNAAAGKSS